RTQVVTVRRQERGKEISRARDGSRRRRKDAASIVELPAQRVLREELEAALRRALQRPAQKVCARGSRRLDLIDIPLVGRWPHAGIRQWGVNGDGPQEMTAALIRLVGYEHESAGELPLDRCAR